MSSIILSTNLYLYFPLWAEVIAQNSQVKGHPLPLSTSPKGKYPLFAYKSLRGVTCSNSFVKYEFESYFFCSLLFLKFAVKAESNFGDVF